MVQNKWGVLMKETKISSKRLFKNFFMELLEDKVLLPNGNTSSRVYVNHPGGACVLAITKNGLLILSKQYRYPIRQISIEIPAGKKENGEAGLLCVTRELEEETGYRYTDIEPMMDTHICVGYSSERIEMFYATGCYKVDNPLSQDEDEFVEAFLVTKEEAVALLSSNTITDGKTIMALQWYLLK